MAFESEGFRTVINGQEYIVTVDNCGDEEVDKRWHTVQLPTGKKVYVDWSPYCYFSRDDLELWLQHGMPRREDVGNSGPFRSDTLKLLSKKDCTS